jgi:hypothetical protein
MFAALVIAFAGRGDFADVGFQLPGAMSGLSADRVVVTGRISNRARKAPAILIIAHSLFAG